VKILATPALLLAILMTFVNTAEADCRCECVDSRMRTFCSSPLDVAVCSGGCLGSVCIGFCSPHGAIAEQSRIEHEAAQAEEAQGAIATGRVIPLCRLLVAPWHAASCT
jgi:hypothetical protein